MINIGIIICALLLVVILCGMLLAIHYERKWWNNGICTDTGDRWEPFDTDSQGGRGYVSGDNYIWISWHCVDGY